MVDQEKRHKMKCENEFCHYNRNFQCLLYNGIDIELNELRVKSCVTYKKYLNAHCWIPVSERLPEIKTDKNGACNFVLIWYDPAPECGSNYGTANTEWVNAHINNKDIKKKWFTHWRELPRPPEGG